MAPASTAAAGEPFVSPRLRIAAFASLCFLAFFAMTDLGGQLKPEHGAVLATLLTIPVWRVAWPELLRQPVVKWVAAYIVFAIAHACYAALEYPALSFSKQMTAAAEPVRLAVFSCVVGWWLSLMPQRIPALFGLMVAGMLLAIVAYMPWQDLPLVWDGKIRPKFGMPENLGGLLAALGGWLALCMLLRLWNTRGRFGRGHLPMALCMLAYAASLAALLFSQSRGAWFAFAATVPVCVAALWYRWRRGRAPVPWLPLACTAAVSLVLVLGARDIVAKRFAGAERLLPQTLGTEDGRAGATQKVAAQPRADKGGATAEHKTPLPSLEQGRKAERAAQSAVNNQAVSARITLYELGMQRWRERPWLGWGMRTTSALIAGSGMRLDGQRHAHLHSAYLDALVGMGLIGTVLFAVFVLLLVRELLQGWRKGVVSTAAFSMVAGSLGIVLVANGFDSLMWRYDYSRAPLEILFGCCVAYGLIRRRQPGAA